MNNIEDLFIFVKGDSHLRNVELQNGEFFTEDVSGPLGEKFYDVEKSFFNDENLFHPDMPDWVTGGQYNLEGWVVSPLPNDLLDVRKVVLTKRQPISR